MANRLNESLKRLLEQYPKESENYQMRVLWILTIIVAFSITMSGQTDGVKIISKEQFWKAREEALALTQNTFPRIETHRIEIYESKNDKAGREILDRVNVIETIEFVADDTFRLTKEITNSKGKSVEKEIQIKGYCYYFIRSKWVKSEGICFRKITASGVAEDINVEKDEYLLEQTTVMGNAIKTYTWKRYFKPSPLGNRGSSKIKQFFQVNSKGVLINEDDLTTYTYNIPIKPIVFSTSRKAITKRRNK